MNNFLDEGFAHGNLPDAPLMVELEPINSCNLRCKMCHVTLRPSEVRYMLPRELIEKLDCIRGSYVALGSGFEPTIYPHIVPLLNKLSDLKCGLEIITNGVLLRGDLARALNNTDVKIINLSFDGARRETYEAIRQGSSYDLVLENIIAARNNQVHQDTLFAVNFTVMHSNVAEVPEAVALWDNIGFNQLRILGLVVRDREPQLLNESLFPILDNFYEYLYDAATEIVRNGRKITLHSPHFFYRDRIDKSLYSNIRGGTVYSDHPETRFVPRNRQRIQTVTDRNGNIRCRSPFTFAKVLFNGDVQICYKFSIGNLHSHSLAEIWHGEKAQEVRKMVINDEKHCKSCDYFRYCLSSDRVDYDKLENHFSTELIPDLELKTEKKITFKDKLPNEPPRLVLSVGNLNIVHFKSQYLIVPQSLESIDLSTRDIHSIAEITVATNFRDAKAMARAMASKNGSC